MVAGSPPLVVLRRIKIDQYVRVTNRYRACRVAFAEKANSPIGRKPRHLGREARAECLAARGEVRTVDVVGPICESGDFFAQDRELPKLEQGELVALLSAGAYGFVMASNYNSRPFPAEVLVDGAEAKVVRERQSYEDLIAGEE